MGASKKLRLVKVVQIGNVDIGRQLPQTRQECPTERPCPYVSCKHHLYLEVTSTGSIMLNFPGKEPWELEQTCSIDMAESSPGLEQERVAEALGVTRQRVDQVEKKALAKCQKRGVVLKEFAS